MTIRIDDNYPIAFIDDDQTELLLARKYLQRSKLNNPMLEFESGEAFIEHMQRVADGQAPMPALALIDGRMPGLSGCQVVEAIRRRREFRDLPLLVLFSNSDDPADVRAANRVGADGYLVKPSDGAAYLELLNSFAAAAV